MIGRRSTASGRQGSGSRQTLAVSCSARAVQNRHRYQACASAGRHRRVDVAGLTAGEPARFEVESYPGQTFGARSGSFVCADRERPPPRDGGELHASASTSSWRPSWATPRSSTSRIPTSAQAGMTAEVVLDGAQASNVIRIPTPLRVPPPAECCRCSRNRPGHAIARRGRTTEGRARSGSSTASASSSRFTSASPTADGRSCERWRSSRRCA